MAGTRVRARLPKGIHISGESTVQNDGTFPVQVDSSVLPTGAATSAKQDTGNTSVASIDTKTPALVSGRVPVDGSGVTQPIAGTVEMQASTSGGCSVYHHVSAASTNATVIKASPGQVYGLIVRNTSGVIRKIAFHNTASTPTAGTGIYFTIHLNNTAAPVLYTFPMGVAFSTGIAFTMVTGTADSDATAVAANDLLVEFFYK